MEPKTNLHSFVLRIWLEEAATDTQPAKWRGHITHLLDNRRRHIESIDEIGRFIEVYLNNMGQDATP